MSMGLLIVSGDSVANVGLCKEKYFLLLILALYLLYVYRIVQFRRRDFDWDFRNYYVGRFEL